ncbi:MAG TPA: Na+/H+ antiporter subunit D [Phycisphaerae bacterium]|jgi:multicomponent Na+:H+ antiporter subunit D|nr:Na+/H+ antiporter subunit D [Phycisphaerae bacterium]HOB73046.1 Na+/H+ antiporter subunit D [Phycisphaerae bacterium]HOJ54073.1 Na+/H+ antiporter subunit D [Phycisphaerae bacterium]HOL26484.1 Na+/H+ antiporter subunit D [Phycisphaerae bacterium]HPP20463.1 Na+/H+ antiporter subunit D [Phycisphaerae bacterium]
MRVLLVLPILVPLVTTVALLLAWGRRGLHRRISLAGAIALLAAAVGLLVSVWRHGILATQMGGWPAPFGITLVADLFGAIMVVLGGLMGLAVIVYSLASIDRGRERFGYHPLLHGLLMGVCGAFLTGDIFNLYVWFEVMLISSFVLLALGGEQAQLEGSIKYVALNLLSSALFLSAVGILYGTAGTLNMADLSQRLSAADRPTLVTAMAMLFLVAFGIKAAVFPLFFWLPASYHTPPVAVSAIFAGLLTKVGVYALIRVFTLLFVQDPAFTHNLILLIAGFTMVTGVLGAAVQGELRRILSFHIVSQIGYMVMGLGLLTVAGLAGSIFYIIHHIIVKTNLFLVSGVVHRLGGSYQLSELGGLYRVRAWLAVLFLIPALSLAGIPPLSGFWAKLMLIRAGLESGRGTIVAVALGVSLLTLYSMTKIWAEVFWKAPPGKQSEPAPRKPAAHERLRPRDRLLLYGPVAALATLTVLIGLWAAPVFALAERAAEQLTHPAGYIAAVLAERP